MAEWTRFVSLLCPGTRPLILLTDSVPGDVLFGGVDTEKFEGNMSVLPALTRLDFLGEGRDFFNLASMTILNGSANVELLRSHPNASFEMDYGEFASSVPPDVFDSISEIIGGVQLIRRKNSGVQGALVPCSVAYGSFSLNFTFGYKDVHTQVAIPISAFISSPETTRSQPALSETLSSNSTELCLFNLWPGSRGDYLSLEHSVVRLGAFALKSVYTIFNRTNQTIGVAQARPNVTRSNILGYNHGCFPGAQFVNASSSSACAPSTTVPTALPTEIFTNTPTNAPVNPTPTSGAVNLRVSRLPVILAALFLVIHM
jgi:Eukaryotic aspartyl protease